MRLGFHAPETEEELAALVFEAAETRTPLEIMGKGTKRELGHPVPMAEAMDRLVAQFCRVFGAGIVEEAPGARTQSPE